MDPIYSTQAALANAALLRIIPVTETATEVATPVEEAPVVVEAVAACEAAPVAICEEAIACAAAEAPQVEMTVEEPVVTTKTKKSTKKATTKAKSTSTEA